jgi:hypothetical protein
MSIINFSDVFARQGFHDQDFIHLFNATVHKLSKQMEIEDARKAMQERYNNRKFSVIIEKSLALDDGYSLVDIDGKIRWNFISQLDFGIANEYENWLFERSIWTDRFTATQDDALATPFTLLAPVNQVVADVDN